MKPFKLSIRSKSLVVTSLGVRFILLMMAIGIAAINTGNNLLYLILAMMLSLMVISGVLSEACLYHLRYRRELPEFIYAGQPARMTFVVYNDKKIIPSFSLLIKDSLEGYSEGVTKDKYFFKLRPASFQERIYPLFFSQRGVYPLRGVSFSTRFPFGIFLKIKEEEEKVKSEIIVFPRIFKVFPPVQKGNLTGAHFSLRKGHGVSLYQFRSYFPGDDARSIHWKTSAKKQKLIVREYEEEDERKISIGISNSPAAPPSQEDLNRFEKGIELAASYASYYLKEGFQLSFFTDQASLPLGKGALHLKEILILLSSLKVDHRPERLFQRRERGDLPVILISPLQAVRAGLHHYAKVFQPEEIDRMPYWSRS
jgi:uncharacterized protein (DUF58 family)